MLRVETPELLPLCQLQYFPINQPEVLVVRKRYHVATNVDLRVNRMAIRLERNTGNLMDGETLILSVPTEKHTRI